MRYRVKENIEKLPRYTPGKPIQELFRETGVDPITKLASNENPLGPSPLAVAAIAACAPSVSLYPDASGHDLKAALSELTNVPTTQISLANGSDETIQNLGLALLEPGDNVIMGDPSFPRYEASAQLSGAETRKVRVDSDWTLDLDAMLAATDANTRIIWIANPNNPTGTLIRRPAFERFLDRLPEGVLVVLDEAYFEFVRDSDAPNSADYVLAGRPVVGIRTLSKTYGLAGLRIGYAMCDPTLHNALEKVRGPFNVNSVAQAAALAALRDRDYLAKGLELNQAALARLMAMLPRFGLTPVRSHANFVWASCSGSGIELCSSLLRHGVIVRSGDSFGFPDCVRISVGTDAQLDHLESALSQVLQGAGA